MKTSGPIMTVKLHVSTVALVEKVLSKLPPAERIKTPNADSWIESRLLILLGPVPAAAPVAAPAGSIHEQLGKKTPSNPPSGSTVSEGKKT